MDKANSTTNLSLLAKLRSDPADQKSWREFVEYYGAKIYAWGLQWGLQPSDAQNMTQDVLVSLSKQMKRFEYKPGGRFRSWLKTVAYRAWVDFLEDRRKSGAVFANESLLETLASQEACDGFLAELERRRTVNSWNSR